MKVINTKLTHSASVASGITFSGIILFLNFGTLISNNLLQSIKLLHFAAYMLGFLIYFCFGYIICRFLLLVLYPIYLRTSKKISIIIFTLVGASVAMITKFLLGSLLRSTFDAPFSMNYESMASYFMFGIFGSCCAIPAWYVLRKHEPNNALQRTSR
ncbi:MAG: hypothetical protein V7760_04615 [Marinobacter sp.]|jgi:hypothetical protein